MPTAAAIYVRISSDPDGTMLGVNRQEADCCALAERRGWSVAAVYQDNDVSAYRGKPRPEYRRMLDDIRAGAIDAVIVWHLDRLHRNPKELEEFFEVCDAAGLRALASVTGDTDLGTDDGRFVARIMGAVARKESDDKSRRLIRKHQELAQAGKPTKGGNRPFGYRDDFVTVEPTESAAVREAVERILAGDSLRAVAADWNARGLRSVTDREWTPTVLRGMLLSARISGQRSYHGEIVATGQWEPIITPEQGARLRALLTDPARRTGRTVRRYLLAGGLLRCGRCGATLIAQPRPNGTRRYICAKRPGVPGCGGIAILAEPLEMLIAEAVLYRLDTPELAAALAGEEAQDVQAEQERAALAADRAQREELATAYGDRLVTLSEYLTARRPIEARIERAERRLARQSRAARVAEYVGRSAALREAWSDLPLNRQRAIVAALLDRALVGPAVRPRFDPDRITPVWRV
jgi:DNA invertase Pin-like site-specific DNA recombinase